MNFPFPNQWTRLSKEFLLWSFLVVEIIVVSMMLYAFFKGVGLRSIAGNITITCIALLALASLRLLLRAHIALGLLGLATFIAGLCALSVP